MINIPAGWVFVYSDSYVKAKLTWHNIQ